MSWEKTGNLFVVNILFYIQKVLLSKKKNIGLERAGYEMVQNLSEKEILFKYESRRLSCNIKQKVFVGVQ